MNLTITSTAFSPNGAIPALYTCEGNDIAPPLAWSGVPAGTRSLALIVDDPTRPIPPHPDDLGSLGTLQPAADDAGPRRGHRVGCVAVGNARRRERLRPVGRHRYFHKLYALDPVLPDLKRPDKAALEKAMEGHILAQAVLIGTYQKGR